MVRAIEVEPFVLANLYEILQLKSSWIKLEVFEFEPLRNKLRDKYFLTFGSEAAWKKCGSHAAKRTHVKQFNAAIKGWLNANYPTHSAATFNETNEVIFDDELWPKAAKKRLEIDENDYHAKCPSNCEDEDKCELRCFWVECGANCKMPQCKNRDAQKTFEWWDVMQLKYINRWVGAGVFAKQHIRKGQFLGTLAGRALPRAQAVALDSNDKENDYAFQVDHKNNFALWTIDPKKNGNVLRFVNHNCEPTCVMQIWTVQGRRTVKMIALRDIEEGEELTFDYAWNKPTKRCFCGSLKCKGVM